MVMDYSFNLGAVIAGFAITVAGLLIIKFYKQLGDNFGFGVASYQKFKLAGLIGVVAGLLIMFNLHTLVLEFIANTFFGSLSS